MESERRALFILWSLPIAAFVFATILAGAFSIFHEFDSGVWINFLTYSVCIFVGVITFIKIAPVGVLGKLGFVAFLLLAWLFGSVILLWLNAGFNGKSLM